MASDAKKKKGFYIYLNQKRKVQEGVPLSDTDKLITTDKKAEVVYNCLGLP